MSQFLEASHEFVRASENVSAGVREGCSASTMQRAERELAEAGARMEYALQDMMEKAVRNHLANMQHLPADLYELLNSNN